MTKKRTKMIFQRFVFISTGCQISVGYQLNRLKIAHFYQNLSNPQPNQTSHSVLVVRSFQLFVSFQCYFIQETNKFQDILSELKEKKNRIRRIYKNINNNNNTDKRTQPSKSRTRYTRNIVLRTLAAHLH